VGVGAGIDENPGLVPSVLRGSEDLGVKKKRVLVTGPAASSAPT